MKKNLTILLIAHTVATFGQVNPAIWDTLKTVKTDNYEFEIPNKWEQRLMTGPDVPEQMIEASGLAFPEMFNGSPVILTIFIVKQDSKNLDDCKERCLLGYRANPDREFPEKFKDRQEKITLPGGQDAYFLSTRFFRKSKGLNQSRFDLVVFSNKAKAGYLYTVSIQYADDDYKFETENKLPDFSKKLYSYFKIID
jgi:hypothetical protein